MQKFRNHNYRRKYLIVCVISCLVNYLENMIIITLVLLFHGVFSQSITVTPNTTSVDIVEGGNFTIEYKIDPELSNILSVRIYFDNYVPGFFIHRGGELYTIPNCNITFNNLTKTLTLHLYNVTKDNNGTYGFEFVNFMDGHYEKSNEINVHVRDGPQYSSQILITTGLESNLSTYYITVKEGDVLNLSCVADCNPTCNYSWNNNNGNDSYLTVKANRKTEYITCTTENQYGRDNASVKVNVLYSSEITNITTLNGKQTVNETDSENITIKCSAIGNPKPHFSWLKNGDRIKLYKNNHMSTYEHKWISEDSRTEYLLIQSLGCNTTGNYTCISYNGIGNDSKTMSVFVNCKPKFLKPSKNLKKKKAADTDFEVWYEGFPAPKFNWTFQAEDGNKDIDFTNSIINVHRRDGLFRFKSVLLLKGMHINRPGRYKIDVWNFLGHASRELYILDSEVVRKNVYIAVFLPVLCFVLPICIVAMCKIHGRKRRNAKVDRDEERRRRRSDRTDFSNVNANRVREIGL